MFNKVLVANRGEIAVRIIRTLKEMGIASVAIYSTAEAEALHVQLADEAIAVGGPQARDSYLNMQNILSAALLSGADAIHPGYGFLSESETFAEMVTAVGIQWIGPSADVIALMGNKSNARLTMQAAGVPTIPGSTGFVSDVAEIAALGATIGYPILLKAAAGGGGRGMRFVHQEAEIAAAFAEARAEAASCFGDDRLYVEKVLTDVRHIEVQVVRDRIGNVVAFPERDCSLQRKNQKMLEESPAVGIDPAQRATLGQMARDAVEALAYENMGTLEFLADQSGNFYFMEMNTRIQVEHPVTEAVTGIDLIRMQIEVAAGQPLSVTQDAVQVTGHALEVRLNAEDPSVEFRPVAGQLERLDFAFGGPGVRVDTGVLAGSQISPFYDSMISKIIVHAPTRAEAFTRMTRVLTETKVTGVATNLAFQLALVQDPEVLAAKVHTKSIETVILPAWQGGLDE